VRFASVPLSQKTTKEVHVRRFASRGIASRGFASRGIVSICAIAVCAIAPFVSSAHAEPGPLCVLGALTLQSPPTISGSTAVGGTLTVSTGTWYSCGEQVTGYTYAWFGSGGSSSNSYVVQPGDAGGSVSAAVAACNADGCAAPATASVAIPASGGSGSGGGGCTPQTCPPPPPPKQSDRDGDGVPDVSDNCPDAWNSLQGDADGDWVGDACDTTVPADFLNGTLSSEQGSDRSFWTIDPGTLAVLPCKNAWAQYTYTNLVRVYVLWKYRLSFDFCYVPGSRIVRATGLYARGVYASWPWSFQGNAVEPRWITAAPGAAVHASAQGKFAACVGIGVIGVCGGSRSPYLDLYANGAPSTWFTGGIS